jgi:hypothetical protein
MRNIIKQEPIFLMSDFFYAIKRNWRQALIFGILDILFCALLVYDVIFFYYNIGVSFFSNVCFYMSLFIVFLYFVMRFYIYPMMVTFSLSIGMIYLTDYVQAGGRFGNAALWAASCGLFFLCYLAHDVLFPKTDFGIEYGFFGVLLPVFAYIGARKQKQLQYFTASLALFNLTWGGIQWFSMAAIPFIALYNGKRGKRKMKYLFYIYYPAHLVVIHFLSLL